MAASKCPPSKRDTTTRRTVSDQSINTQQSQHVGSTSYQLPNTKQTIIPLSNKQPTVCWHALAHRFGKRAPRHYPQTQPVFLRACNPPKTSNTSIPMTCVTIAEVQVTSSVLIHLAIPVNPRSSPLRSEWATYAVSAMPTISQR